MTEQNELPDPVAKQEYTAPELTVLDVKATETGAVDDILESAFFTLPS